MQLSYIKAHRNPINNSEFAGEISWWICSNVIFKMILTKPKWTRLNKILYKSTTPTFLEVDPLL